jgi:hypothetical protein
VAGAIAGGDGAAGPFALVLRAYPPVRAIVGQTYVAPAAEGAAG